MLQVRSRFPLPLLIAALILHSLALTAAVSNIQWGAHPSRTDALLLAWLYINISLAASLFLLWPITALRPGAHFSSLLWELPTLLIAAIPSVGLAVWLSEVTLPALLRALALQAAFALFCLGLLSRRGRTWRRQVLIAAALSFLFLVLPVLAYLQSEFLPALSPAWFSLIPTLALHAATTPSPSSITSWVAPTVYFLLGLLLLLFPHSPSEKI